MDDPKRETTMQYGKNMYLDEAIRHHVTCLLVGTISNFNVKRSTLHNATT